MANNVHRTADQRLAHLARVASMLLAGRYQHEVAAELGVSRQQIGYDLRILRRQWISSALVDFHQLKAEQIAKIDDLERTYHEAWRQSQRPVNTLTTTIGRFDSKAVRTVTSPGDVRYLQGVMRCIDMRCRFLGLDAPRKLELTGARGAPLDSGFDAAVAIARQVIDERCSLAADMATESDNHECSGLAQQHGQSATSALCAGDTSSRRPNVRHSALKRETT